MELFVRVITPTILLNPFFLEFFYTYNSCIRYVYRYMSHNFRISGSATASLSQNPSVASTEIDYTFTKERNIMLHPKKP